MSYKRYDIKLAYKEPLSSALKSKLTDLEAILKDVKKDAVKVNKDKSNEENTITATKHTCYHDNPDNKIKCSDTLQEI